ncbi:glycosyl hydrolase family 18 protein [Bacillus seohaeanensis]|jgi:spore germination protein YaaH|uniref:Glycosyl hydrolase family 18 protein n=1 Tax=Bacillus seohaeanensis TaxID=284580 RepID=A0ABW5RUA2_9BACI
MNSLKKVIGLLLVLIMIVNGTTPSHAQTNLFNMSYIFFGGPNSYLNQVNATKGSLDVVSPSYFDITKEGRLSVTWTLQTSFINEMHKRGIKVVPFLSNHWNYTAGTTGLENREQLAKEVASAIEKYHLDGVNVDIEGIGSAYKDVHTDFIRLLRQYVPRQKEVSVSVAANPNGWKTGWHGFYDYKRISDYADYLMIMAYDESWESPDSPIGPVASISFSERSIQYAINQEVPKEKIVYGLPFYGRMWKLDGPTLENRSITGMGLSSTRVDPLVTKFNGKIQFDEKTQSSYATFTIPRGESAFVGSTKLTEGEYIIWYENERSIKAKLRLPTKYGIKGTGSWSLYHETPNTWDYYSLWLNGSYFVDVPSDYWAEPSIHLVSQKGWMLGNTSTTFSPNTTLTRAQGAVILVRALGNEEMEPKEFRFKDIRGHWAQKEIEIARELGYLDGKKPGFFDPNAPLTRAQLAKILYNIFDYSTKETASSPFDDVPTGHWSYQPIVAIYQQGHITGYKDGTFRPGANSTRAQMAALMERMSADFVRERNE